MNASHALPSGPGSSHGGAGSYHVGPGGPGGYHGSYHGGPGGPAPYHPFYPHYAHWYHGDWHDHWIHPWYYGPVGWFSVGVVAGAVVWDAPWYWGYWPYYNPYYTEVIVIGDSRIDYSRPLVLAAPAPTAVSSGTNVDAQAAQFLEASRETFRRGDYKAALALLDPAIGMKPNDAVLHEYRALILFATGQYRQSAAAVYAVLSVGPGWDWPTLVGFYPDPNVYTAQLRALEVYRREHPDEADVRFLLAYHYLSTSNNEAAVAEFREAMRLNPKDQLSAQLVAGLTADKAQSAAPDAPPPASALPVTAASLTGVWEASREDGASFSFQLFADQTYTWDYRQNGKAQHFAGAYTVAENLLILKHNGNPTMIGQIAFSDANHFSFKLTGSNPADPGLSFSRK